MSDIPENGDIEFQNSRAHLEPLGFEDAPADTNDGTIGGDTLIGDPEPEETGELPGALAYWSFTGGVGNEFSDARGGPSVFAFTQEDGLAVPAPTPPTRADRDGNADAAGVQRREQLRIHRARPRLRGDPGHDRAVGAAGRSFG